MTMPDSREIRESNRQSWNAATRAHNSHKRDQAAFLRAGGSTLFPEEVELLGDVSGLRLAHLQCNAGQDSLSLASRGALVTGVDISDEAIDFAKTLSTNTGIPATFVRMDLYDWFAHAHAAGAQFDVAFCSYGTICWLPDLERWAAGIAGILVPGGRFVFVDFHPALMMFSETFQLESDYFCQREPTKWDDGVSDYVEMSGPALAPSGYEEGVRDFRNTHPAYEYQWPLSTALTALLRARLQLEQFCEYPFTNGFRFSEHLRAAPGGRFYPPEGCPSIPLMFGLAASKPRSAR